MRLVHDPLADTNVPPSFAPGTEPVIALDPHPFTMLSASYRACSEPLPEGECLRRSGHHGDHRLSLRRTVKRDLKAMASA